MHRIYNTRIGSRKNLLNVWNLNDFLHIYSLLFCSVSMLVSWAAFGCVLMGVCVQVYINVSGGMVLHILWWTKTEMNWIIQLVNDLKNWKKPNRFIRIRCRYEFGFWLGIFCELNFCCSRSCSKWMIGTYVEEFGSDGDLCEVLWSYAEQLKIKRHSTPYTIQLRRPILNERNEKKIIGKWFLGILAYQIRQNGTSQHWWAARTLSASSRISITSFGAFYQFHYDRRTLFRFCSFRRADTKRPWCGDAHIHFLARNRIVKCFHFYLAFVARAMS